MSVAVYDHDVSFTWLDSVMEDASTASIISNPSPESPAHSLGSPSGQHSARTNVKPSTSRASASPQAGSSCSASSSRLGSSNPPRRRIRPKIALDPSQPLTARGKPRARVYVACKQCRIRKARCDGAKPVCFNCRKRPPEEDTCSYDPQPKRRGQDKVPGTRVRTSESQTSVKRKRLSGGVDDNSADGDDHENNESDSTSHQTGGDESQSSSHLQPSYDNFPMLSSDDEYDPFPLVDLDPPSAEFELGRYKEREQTIPPRPSLQFTRETWWDALLTFYSTEDSSTEMEIFSLTSDQRMSTVQRVVTDLRALFHSSIYWVSFINIPRFFDALFTPSRRGTMQPSLVLSALAVGKYAQSSEAEQGSRGRAKALKLLELAHGALQASLASGWVDIGLIQAAWLMVYFEMQSHSMQSKDRGRSSLLLLDSLIRLFSLTTLDADLKRACTSSISTPSSSGPGFTPLENIHATLAPSTLPVYYQFQPHPGTDFIVGPSFPPSGVSCVPPTEPIIPDNIMLGPSTTSPSGSCNCASLCLAHTSPAIREMAPSWAGTLMWPENVSEGEFRKEECRRLVWATVMVTASMNSYTSVLEDIEKNQLWIKDPDNYALLFPGETLAMAGVPVPANNVWTLYLRAMLLLHSCVRKRGDMSLSDSQRAEFAMRAWLEIDALENALNQHTCELERNFGFQSREMLFSARMCVSHEFQRYIPQVTTTGRLFYRDKAESWLKHRMVVAERVWKNLLAGIKAPALDYRKPLLIYWFMSHIIKALVLWKADPTLTVALEASRTFAKRTEYLMMFWPCPEQRRDWQKLRYQLVDACLKSGVPPPDTELPGPIPRIRKDPA